MKQSTAIVLFALFAVAFAAASFDDHLNSLVNNGLDTIDGTLAEVNNDMTATFGEDEDIEMDDEDTALFGDEDQDVTTVTGAMLKCMGAKPDVADAYADAITQTMTKFSITNPVEIQSFLGNILEETGEFRDIVEKGTMCKKYSDGGCTYKGRGMLQLTHRDSYQRAGAYFGQNFAQNPDLVAQPPWSFLTAGWEWSIDKKISTRCFKSGKTDICALKCASAYINGYHTNKSATCGLKDPIGWKERQAQYAKVGKCLQAQ